MGGRQDGDHDLLVKVALEISSEPVEDRVFVDVKTQLRVSCVVNHLSKVGMFKCEERLRRRQLETVLKREKIF